MTTTITNYVDNPVAASDTSGWLAGSDTELVRTASLPTTVGLPAGVTTGFVSTATALRTASINGSAVDPVAVAAAGAHIFSVYVYIPAAWTGGDISLRRTNYTGATGAIEQAAAMATRDAWQRIVLGPSGMVADDLSGNFQLAVGNPWNAGEEFTFTAAMVHEGSSPVDFFAGTIIIPDARTLHPVLKIGSSHIGPLRVGERN